MIANPAKKIKIANISIQGKEYLVKERDRVEGYMIKKITAGILIITYKGKKFTINRGQ
jgi:hypothetical protein